MGPEDKTSFFYERKQVARQIKKAREEERKENVSYEVHRSGKEYLYRIGGLECLAKYLRTLSSKKILDVGAGTGNASKALSKMHFLKGLEIGITTLHPVGSEISEYFKKDRIHITGVESLRGIKNDSIAGIIGVNSIAYSDSLELAVKRLDEVLIKGGVIKATFHSLGSSENFNGSILKDPTKFIELIARLGYDVSFMGDNRFRYEGFSQRRGFSNSIVLAVKPGNPKAPAAKSLLFSDYGNIQKEALSTSEDGYPVFDIED